MGFDFVSFFPRAVMQGIPLLFGSTGEILTEKSGNLNLGIPGIMYVGGISPPRQPERHRSGYDHLRRGRGQLLRRLPH